jgi:hypothetical protein
MDNFFNWLSKPLHPEDINMWKQANNIVPELTDLFRDFCFSFYYLVRDTYLGDSYKNYKETVIGLTEEDKSRHFDWCWNKTIENFKKENIHFNFEQKDVDYFKNFFFEVFYNQKNKDVKDALEEFFKQLFDSDRPFSKSDLEMFTDVYKTLERSLQL